MLIGAHVSTGGGLVNAHRRGIETESDAIQIFNQSPRMWRPVVYKDDDVAEFNRLMAGGPVEAVVIHAVYLINPASDEDEIRSKSLASLTEALRLGDSIGALGVVIHPGALKGKPLEEGLRLAGDAFKEALAESERCPLLLENTAGAGGTLGRSFAELYDLIARGGGDERLGICLDSCHMYASGFDVRTPDGLEEVIDECVAVVGLDRLRCLHVNDSKVPLGANRDRHAGPGMGELGRDGLAAFLSEPRFEDLPALLETGSTERAPLLVDVQLAKELRAEGLRARGGRAGRTKARASRAGRRTSG
ncbi:MAG: deoxyribonuclease IV [Thermoleophilaceae bacterium]